MTVLRSLKLCTKPAGSAIFALLFWCLIAPASAAELRALWVDAWHNGFLNATQVTQLVTDCKAYNFNAVVVQVRRRGDAFYIPQSPNLEPRTTVISAGFDALADIITKCHGASPPIQVHVWTPTHLIWSDNANSPSQANHVYNLHPEYLMKNTAGDTWIGEGYFIDPGHPGTTQWNVTMAKDIVSRYDIDGFHWDYIRYPQQDSGFNDTAISRYKTEFGLSTTPSYTNSQFSTWRRRQVTDFLRWSSSELLAIKPNLVISTSVFGSRTDAYSARFQDWAAWNSEGILDLCFPMNYTPDNALFNSRTDDAYNYRGIRQIVMGPGAYMNTKENTLTQILYSRSKGMGSSLYSYAVPNSGTVDKTGTFTYLKNNYQPTWQDAPALPWKTAPTKGIIKGTITRQGTGAAMYNATITLLSSPQKVQLTEPHGKYAFFEVPAGTYTVRATSTGLGTITGSITVVAGQVVTLDLVVPSSDGTAPVITSVASSYITDTTARITWTTDEGADTTVEYGTTPGYGSTVNAAALVTAHSIDLTGLAPSTLYHYRVKSKDVGLNTGTSVDYTFTTNASGVVSDVIIDNVDATFVGTWATASSATDKYDTDYRYKSATIPGGSATFTPNLPKASTWCVYEWHPAGSNRTTGAPHVITHAGGTDTVTVNQQIDGGQWNLLGQYSFAAGTAGNVRLTNAIPDFSVFADAIKFSYVEPPVPNVPTSLTASGSGMTIMLQWTDASNNETGFQVCRATVPGGPYTVVTTTAANATSYVDSPGAVGTFYYVIRSTAGGTPSADSNEASDTTTDAPELAATPVAGQKSVTLSWSDNTSGETGYAVYRLTAPGGGATLLTTLPVGSTSYVDDAVLYVSDTTWNGSFYYFVTATGVALNSNVVAFTPVQPPDVVMESRQWTGTAIADEYAETIVAGSWFNTAGKSLVTNPRVRGVGGRFTGDNSNGNFAEFTPGILTSAWYEVMVTGPDATGPVATRAPYAISPDATADVRQGGAVVLDYYSTQAQRTYDNSSTNTDLADKWMSFSPPLIVRFDAGSNRSIRLTNHNPSSSSSAQRFDVDAIRLRYDHDVPVTLSTWTLE